MGEYAFQTFDLPTGLVGSELPLRVSSLPMTLNTVDQARFSLSLTDTSKLPKGWEYEIYPGRTGILALRDGVSIGSAWIIWEVTSDDSGKAVTLNCTDMEGFYAKQTLDVDMSFENVDQHSIARELGQYVDSLPGGNIGVQWGSALSGILRTRSEYFGSEHKSIFELWSQLSGVEDGIDFRIRSEKISGAQVQHQFLVGSPLGNVGAELMFEYSDSTFSSGGNVLQYRIMRPTPITAAWAIGAGEGDSQVQALEISSEIAAAGFPRIVKTLAHKSVADVTILRDYALSTLSQSSLFLPECEVAGDVDPIVGSYAPGDFARLLITSPEFPAQSNGSSGLSLPVRIYQQNVNVVEDTVALSLQVI